MAFGLKAKQVIAPFSARSDSMMAWLAKHQQTIKWLVYALLLVNFGMYIIEDIGKFQRALSQGQSLLAATTRLATSLDLVGWFALLAIFEIESYWLRRGSNRAVASALHIVRLGCLALIANTFFIYFREMMQIGEAVALSSQQALCDLNFETSYFLLNQTYSAITAANCAALAGSLPIIQLAEFGTYTNTEGLAIACLQAWASLIESGVWIIYATALTVIVVLRQRAHSMTALEPILTVACRASIAIILCCAASWAYHGHYLYTWDSCLWIAGFTIIEANLSQWRKVL